MKMIYMALVACWIASAAAETPPSHDPARVITSLDDLIAYPLAYEGRIFRGYVYVLAAPSFYAFFPRPVLNPVDVKESDLTIMPGPNSADLNQFRLHSGQRILIEGTVAPDRNCFVALCVPFGRTVFINDMRVLRVGMDRLDYQGQ